MKVLKRAFVLKMPNHIPKIGDLTPLIGSNINEIPEGTCLHKSELVEDSTSKGVN